ncbi:chaplin family protein [Nonomuraea sp. NPDC052634]|uniref:chaplin family protein n=1 Tax=Nonomuraea sp. NPDC052634 TaxID=3155813 RepID=UPI003440CA12
MRTWAKASSPAALLAVAVMSFGGGTALADTSGNGSVGGGNQVDLPISLPIDISGNSIAAIGKSEATSRGGAEVVDTRRGGIPNKTSGNGSVLGGNQVNAPISVPINACGNAVSLIGKSDAGCQGGSSVRTSGKGGAGGNRTSGDGSVLGGNQITAPISAPINACGNAVAIFGDATAGCKGGATVHNTGKGAGGNRTSGNGSVLGGNQVVAPISVPITICGNSVAAVGRAFAGCQGGSSVTNNGGPGKRYHVRHHKPGSTGNDTDGRFGVGSGNQVIAPITLPIDVCGNAVGNAAAGCRGGATVHQSGSGGGNRTSGRGGVLSGNQVVAPVTAPINVCGNAVALIGQAFAGCKGGATAKTPLKGAGGNRTSGAGGVLSGNQVVAPITAPINACGNAAAVVGLSRAGCQGGASVHQSGKGAGGNRTSGAGGVLSGNQVVAPITAPVNVCGNAAAVLGDAAAGCLGGSRVGKPVHHGPSKFGHFGRTTTKVAATKGGGLLPVAPALPVLGGGQEVGAAAAGLTKHLPATDVTKHLPGAGDLSGFTQHVEGVGNVREATGPAKGVTTQLPVVDDISKTLGLPALPELPGLTQAPATPPKRTATPPKRRVHHAAAADSKSRASSADRKRRTASSSPISALSPATDLVASTPAGSAVTSATRSLPIGDIGLMSAEQPAGVTGMNSGSLLALAFGGMLAAAATLFASARRFRFGRK